MDAQTTTEATEGHPAAENQPADPNVALVPDHIIAAHLPHPVVHGTPLSRGARYIHNFEVELVSDGRRLWASASNEGKAIINTLAEESRREHDAIEAHKAKQAQI